MCPDWTDPQGNQALGLTDAPRQTEPSVNNALGGLLQGMLPGREVRAEHTRAIAERRGLQPDVLITAAGRSPVVIEAEYEPAGQRRSPRRRPALGGRQQ